MSARATVAIVGGGAAGALTAIHLARSASPPRVVLIERAARIARGVAFATAGGTHLLNVPAARMSALADDPEHFLRWLRRHAGAAVSADTFVARGLYGEYLAETLECASVRAGRRVVQRRRGMATDVVEGVQPRVHLADGSFVEADRVVLALGNMPPRDPSVLAGAAFYASDRYHANPWAEGALDGVDVESDVLLVGTGLTMYDVALTLHERGHRGRLLAVSRHGLLPRRHAARPLETVPGPEAAHWLAVAPTARALLHAVRMACERNTSGDWRGVVDSLRPVAARLWCGLGERERARFLARLRPFWDVHRHRAPLAVHEKIESLLATGALQVRAARLRAWREDASGVTALCADGELRVQHVINCTGSESDVHRLQDPLVRALLSRGLIVRDALGLGVESAEDGALVGARGRPSPWLYTLGSWLRAARWESTAVPELRGQAAALAERLTRPAACAPRRGGIGAAPILASRADAAAAPAAAALA